MPQDPFNEDDWDSYTAFTSKGLAQIVGDDLLCTNPKRVQKAIDTKACNALLLKVNQVSPTGSVVQARVLRPPAHLPITVHRAIEPTLFGALCYATQIGSLTESIEAVKMSKAAGWGVMTSHRCVCDGAVTGAARVSRAALQAAPTFPAPLCPPRALCSSGETEDSFIADLAVGLATGQIKTGAPCRSERLAKYNQVGLQGRQQHGMCGCFGSRAACLASFQAPARPDACAAAAH